MCWQFYVCRRKGKSVYLYCKLDLYYVPDGELNSYPSDPVLSLVPTTYVAIKRYCTIIMGHCGGDVYVLLMVRGRWSEITWQPRDPVGLCRDCSEPGGGM